MSDNFNIRDFRNADVSEEDAAATSSNRSFYTFALAIPVIAALAGLGYKPLMELRTGSIEATQIAQEEYETERRAKDPLYALMSDVQSGNIDLNSKTVSPRARARDQYSKRALNANEFLNRVDAKANNFSPLEMEVLKYTRTQWALRTCDHFELKGFYTRSNEAKYEALKAKAKTARDAKLNARQAEVQTLELPKIDNQAQALAFVATGGVARHQEAAMSTFAGLANMESGASKIKIRQRRQRFNKTGCMNVRTIVQSGAMNVKTNVSLKR